ncbi:MAG TPA: MerR family transcriptional regulator [Rhizomicrobium sp.]|jgi:DNA-binding transcriptional MerR regulator|nr:MerR family transcriptional regulator [Rhizomicrobium sp.]
MLQPVFPLREKSPEAFRTISEVSADLDVPQHVLRFWESRFAQVRPVKRGGGRRYYRPEDVDLLRGIRTLLYLEGLTIKGVQKVLRDRGMRYVAEVGRGETALTVPAEPEESIPDTAALPTARVLNFGPRILPSEPPPQSAPGQNLSEETRVRLEILLAELLQMKARLRAALSTRTF